MAVKGFSSFMVKPLEPALVSIVVVRNQVKRRACLDFKFSVYRIIFFHLAMDPTFV